jgi:hypothetical protein
MNTNARTLSQKLVQLYTLGISLPLRKTKPSYYISINVHFRAHYHLNYRMLQAISIRQYNPDTMSEHMGNSKLDSSIDYNSLLLRSIVKDIEAAKTHLNNHVTVEKQILTLDKNCEYCLVYLKE